MKARDQQREALRTQFEFTYRTTMEGEARYLRDSMLDKLPPQPESRDATFFSADILAGPYPLRDYANYLESLARKLSP
jgi:hypothetical protein